MNKQRQALTRAMTNESTPLQSPSGEPWTLAPDDLRNQVQGALSTLGEADRKLWRQRLLSRLAHAGVHIGAALFMLGTVVESVDDLTPCDVGKLLRYIRINNPAAIRAIAGPLAELMILKKKAAAAASGSREAA